MPKLNSVDSRQVMQDIYESKFGIFDHFDKNQTRNRPLASVAFLPSEEVIDNSLLEDALRSYVNKGIKETYGLNILEFLELPFGLSSLFIKIANEEGTRKHNMAADIEKQFNEK